MGLKGRFLPSFLMNMNKLLLGYIRGVPYGIYGPPATGKTIYSLFESSNLISQINAMNEDNGNEARKSIMYYDIEGDGDIVYELWKPILDEKFGKQKFVYAEPDLSRKDKNLKVADPELVEIVCKDWGIDARIRKEGERGKVRFEYKDSIPSRVEKLIRANNVGVLVIDSASEAIDAFPGGNMNFPGRSNFVKFWFSRVHRMAKRYNLIVITIHHSSKNPGSKYDRETMTGGGTLLYRFKVVMCFEKVKGRQKRKVRLARHFNKEEWKDKVYIKINDRGWSDSKWEDKIDDEVVEEASIPQYVDE